MRLGGVSSLFLSAPGILPGGGGQEVLIAVERVVVGRGESVNSDQTVLITHCYAFEGQSTRQIVAFVVCGRSGNADEIFAYQAFSFSS